MAKWNDHKQFILIISEEVNLFKTRSHRVKRGDWKAKGTENVCLLILLRFPRLYKRKKKNRV